ncbi:isocitrate lyase/PEP mutase family protein [Streptomyces avicenniae]|uniref:isocitrate lyase/PEP mutase family protein n=1 Tax=Streptomyces avicenniae TaxID=500153 RepID=UPI00069B366D|nr:isocitrate lyase/phosphoenolpyruvate mutase family protein [Streptomyces avicenniae]
MTAQHDKARLLHALHAPDRPVLVLANVWDAAGARIVAAAGAPAVATTSAGVAWGLGAADGGGLPRALALELIARVAASVDLPVTADIETGFGASPDDVAVTVRGVLAAGAVGVNIEDADTEGRGPLRPVAEQAERLRAAREAADAAGVPLFLNARVDTYLRQVGDPADRLRATLDRAAAYVAAGADGVFVPHVRDLPTVSALARELTVPLNVSGVPGSPPVPDLAAAGAARVSLGAAVAEAAYAVVRRAADEAYGPGTYTSLEDALPYTELNALLS